MAYLTAVPQRSLPPAFALQVSMSLFDSLSVPGARLPVPVRYESVVLQLSDAARISPLQGGGPLDVGQRSEMI
eukprot:35638-Hanusia_phi.AAC.1